MSDPNQLLTIDEVAEHLGCSKMHVYRLVKAGLLLPVNISATASRTRFRFTPAALEQYILRAAYAVRTGDATS